MKKLFLLTLLLVPTLTGCTHPFKEGEPVYIETTALSIQYAPHEWTHYKVETDYFNGKYYAGVSLTWEQRGSHKQGDKLIIQYTSNSGFDNGVGRNEYQFVEWIN